MGVTDIIQKLFNDLEALEIAIAIEERGEAFYRAAAKRLKEKESKEMLIRLADEEQDHAETFRLLYEQALDKKLDFDDDYIFDPEVSAYLRAMISSTVFPSQEEQDEIFKRIDGIVDVLKIGIQAEKDSILYYTQMVISSKFVEAKDAFRRLIKEEKKHLIDLQTRLLEYKKRRA